jgi:hypoxanthine phosphoribosyltransferase
MYALHYTGLPQGRANLLLRPCITRDSRMVDTAPGNETIEVVFSAEDIARRVDELAKDIAGQELEPLLIVSVLNGSFVFAADLVRALHRAGVSPQVDFMSLSSYRSATTSSGRVEVLRDLEVDVAGRNVLIVDDILESGRTLAFAKDLISARGAARVLTCVLLDKPVPRAADIRADVCAFECPNAFVIGYGMDLAQRYRELPFVGRVVRP